MAYFPCVQSTLYFFGIFLLILFTHAKDML